MQALQPERPFWKRLSPFASSSYCTLEEGVPLYEELLSRIRYPLSPNHYDTSHVVCTFLNQEKQFIALVDQVFGPIPPVGQLYVEDFPPPPRCWMEDAAMVPDSPAVASLLNFLSPTGSLGKLMIETSVPLPDFYRRLREDWQDDMLSPSAFEPDVLAENPFALFNFAVPLAGISYAASRFIDDLPSGVDFSQVGAEKLPQCLLSPFWKPPIASVPGLGRCVKCNMLGYFLIRMMLYLVGYAQRPEAADTLGPPATRDWVQRFDDRMSFLIKLKWMHADPTTMLLSAPRQPLQRLFQQYLQYVEPSVRHLSETSSLLADNIRVDLRHAGLSARDACCAFLFHSLPSICQRFREPECESLRGPIRSLPHLSVLLHSLPLTIELIKRLPKPEMGSMVWRKTVATEFANINRTTRKNGLKHLRQFFVTAPTVFSLDQRHVNNALRLWEALAGSVEVVTAREGFVHFVQNYEALSTGLCDFLVAFGQCKALRELSIENQEVLLRVLNIIVVGEENGWLQRIAECASVGQPDDPLLIQLLGSAVLVWQEEDSYQRRSTIISYLDRRIQSGLRDLANSLKEDTPPTERIRALVLRLCDRTNNTPMISSKNDPTAKGNQTAIATPSPVEFLTPLLTPERRGAFLYGGKRLSNTAASQAWFGRGQAKETIVGSDEIPVLVVITSAVDQFLERLRYSLAASLGIVPRCVHGHAMRLSTFPCCCHAHRHNKSAWYCELCRLGLCATCAPLPKTKEGFPISVPEGSTTPKLCFSCCAVPTESLQFYFVECCDRWYCGECASLTWPRWSVRFVASNYFWLLVAAVVFIILIGKMFLRSGGSVSYEQF